MSDQKTTDNQAELTPFQRFEKFARMLINVPKHEIDEQRDKDEATKTP